MKKPKITKKRIVIGVPLTLLLLGTIVLIAYLSTNIIRLSSEVVSLRAAVDSARLDIRALNGTARVGLGKCLDDATKDYDNSLKLVGRPTIEDGRTVNYYDFDKWKTINDMYESDRTKCSNKYK